MSKRAVIVPVITLGVAATILFTIRGCWTSWEGRGAEQRTDDAYVRADMTPLSTRVSGTVRKVDVEDFATVKPANCSCKLDDADYQAVLAQARAALAGAQAALEDNQSAKRIQDVKIQNAETVVVQATAAVNAAKAGIAAVQPDVERTGLERKRQESLLASKAATHQQVEWPSRMLTALPASSPAVRPTWNVRKLRSQAVRSLLEAEKRQRAALDTRDNLVPRRYSGQGGGHYRRAGQSRLHADRRAHGRRGGRASRAGRPVGCPRHAGCRPGQRRCLDPGKLQRDAIDQHPAGRRCRHQGRRLPGVVLHGKVVEIAPASGSQFALLPPDNATGNFTKVVQRLPVKIALDQGHSLQGKLRPGFSVVVTIHASGKDVKAEGPSS